MSIYEVHLGSWKRKGENGSEFLTYRELADNLVPYVVNMGFTHVEFLPLARTSAGLLLGISGYRNVCSDQPFPARRMISVI